MTDAHRVPPGQELAPIDELRARAGSWADIDRAARLAQRIGRRAAEAGPGPSTVGPHPSLTTSVDLIDELVAIDAAVVSETLSIARNRARIETNDGVLERLGERYRLAARASVAILVLIAALVVVSVL